MPNQPGTQRVVATPQPVDSTRVWRIGIGALTAIAVAVTVAIALVTKQPANAGVVDGAAVLAFVTGIAVGVE